jgi:cobaltochelatase CobN
MKKAGYDVETPSDGKELITTIMDRKAISEFRWTTVDEIISKGGCIKRVPVEDYNKWFSRRTEKFKKRISGVWGNPPGEEKDGVPAAMVYQGDIVVTGVQYGHAVVCTQPKRGCAGSRCDGQVCKILHDPDLPPPHQYFATYRYLEYDFDVDCIVHVGTHGNLEFLPGKGVGLSQDCSPDLAIGNIPHLYIYNADNPPEGAIAKRRSYATLIDHMQVTMTKSGLNGELEELEKFLGEYYEAKSINKSRAHQLEHLILETLEKTNLSKEIRYSEEMPFDEVAQKTHEAISLLKSSQINKGLHIFGNQPQNEDRVEYIRAIFRSDTENGLSLRSSIFELIGIDLQEALKNQGLVNGKWNMTNGQLLEYIDEISGSFIGKCIEDPDTDSVGLIKELLAGKIINPQVLEKFPAHAALITDIDKRIEDSKEINALFSGFNSEYIPTGPSGKITRGRYDVLPSGKNFYTLDIYKLPTRAAYRVGVNLANSVIEKHSIEEGRLPENVAIYWTCMDITCCDGEGMGQMMSLLGAKPVWSPNGRVSGFEIIPLKELGRPRIDITVRVGGINRDNFPECMAYIDDVIRKVASLDEPEELNFVRKHALQQLKEKGNSGEKSAWDEVTTRIFGSRPGTYMAGVNLAVYASAWKDEKDLADVFVYWNQYAYGKNVFGKEMASDFVANLKTVDITFNKAYTDEYDLFGCCCYFATQGGMTASARVISGKEVKAYYGDTRDTKNVGVRDLSDEVRRVVRSKLLNPKWIEGMKQHGYKGLGDISKKIGRVYGWEATTGEVDDWIFDDIARTFVLDEEMRNEFEKNNPWALEEIGRRLLEANERGLWNADPEVLEQLKENYLEVESWLEEKMGDIEGDFQGGSVDILTHDDVADWGERMQEVRKLIHK